MIIEIEESARKHGCKDCEIEYAVLHAVNYEQIPGRRGRLAFMFVGHPHRGALDDDWLEVGVARWRDGTLRAFHAMRMTDNWWHLSKK
ncbi:hypothetical protein PT282_01245 [Bifidobacterium sp. ESL0763]|uniref:hypothetical protein n=1 Tax=Bifidobacterium sp. ESL0763 TaxID=2983227 RepID=UPI0023F7D295|nr:hypothetical protein [Bifidobacterium sp. ESL0763]MDF7663308.1 hypothetical protein [Bifidobacterium sp. ESL0763]